MDILYLSIFTMIAPILTGLYSWKFLPKGLNLMVLQAFIGFLVNVLSPRFRGSPFIFNLYLLVDFFLIFYAGIGFVPVRFKKVLTVISIAAFLLTWVLSVFILGVNQFASYAVIISALIIGVVYFTAITEQFFDKGLERGIFTVLICTFVFHCSIIPIYSFFHYMVSHSAHSFPLLYQIMMGALCIGRYIGVAVGLLLIKPLPQKQRI